MTNIAIPQAHELTANWFTEALRADGALAETAVVSAVDVQTFGSEESNMSSLHRAALSYEPADAGPPSLIVKLASTSEEQRFISSITKFYEREIRFYNEIAAEMSVSVPRCFLAKINLEDQSFVLVLEEIIGQRQVSQIEGLGYDDAVLAINEMADFHATFWGKDLESESETFLPFDTQMLHDVLPGMFEGQWAAARPKVLDLLPEAVVTLCDNRSPHTSDLLRGMHGTDTLCHGDFRSENLLFNSDGGILALDYQLVVVAHGMTDVAYLISQSVADDVAAERADDLIQVYSDRLASHGIQLDMNEAMAAYRTALIFHLQIPISLLSMEVVPERAFDVARAALRRASAEILRTGAHEQFG